MLRRLSHIEQAIEDHREETKKGEKKTDERLKVLEEKVDTIFIMASRYKGFFAGVLGGGAFVGWMIAQWDNIKAMFK